MLNDDDGECAGDNSPQIQMINKKSVYPVEPTIETVVSANSNTTQLHLNEQELLRIQAMDEAVVIIINGLLAKINTSEILLQIKTEQQNGFESLIATLIVKHGVLYN
jgi:hypothetical protein